MNDEEQPEAPSYVDAADRIGASLIRKQSRGFTEPEAQMVIALAQLESTERLAEAVERLAEVVQVVGQGVGAYVVHRMQGEAPTPETQETTATDDASDDDNA